MSRGNTPVMPSVPAEMVEINTFGRNKLAEVWGLYDHTTKHSDDEWVHINYEQYASGSETTPESSSSATRPFRHSSPPSGWFCKIPYEPSRNHLAINSSNLEASFDILNLPKTLQKANFLWMEWIGVSASAEADYYLLHLKDGEDADILYQDVRQPPLSFSHFGYWDKIVQSKCIYRFLVPPGCEWHDGQPWSPTQIPDLSFLRLTEDEGRELHPGTCAFSPPKFKRIVGANTAMVNKSGFYGLRRDLINVVERRFKAEVIRRVRYIDEFLSWDGMCFGDENPAGFEYYPWLGANVEFDCWLFQKEILRQWVVRKDKSNCKQYNPSNDVFVRMYGLGRNDLEYMRGNPQTEERGEQIATVERFHALQSMLGREATADIRAQFSFCSYTIRDARAARVTPRPNTRPGRFAPPPPPSPEAQRIERDRLAEARRREFKIAKILVDRVWEDVDTKRERALPQQIRGRGRSHGDWYKLGRGRQVELLGGDEQLIRRFVSRYPRWNPSWR